MLLPPVHAQVQCDVNPSRGHQMNAKQLKTWLCSFTLHLPINFRDRCRSSKRGGCRRGRLSSRPNSLLISHTKMWCRHSRPLQSRHRYAPALSLSTNLQLNTFDLNAVCTQPLRVPQVGRLSLTWHIMQSIAPQVWGVLSLERH